MRTSTQTKVGACKGGGDTTLVECMFSITHLQQGMWPGRTPQPTVPGNTQGYTAVHYEQTVRGAYMGVYYEQTDSPAGRKAAGAHTAASSAGAIITAEQEGH